MKNVSSMRIRDCEVVYRPRKVDVVLRSFHSSDDVYRLLGAMDATCRVTESLWVFLLDARQKLLGVHECARGGVASVAVEVQDVFRAAIVIGARAIILAHNHPSGDCTPSVEDHAFTERVLKAAELLGIPLLDHVVVSSDGYYSFADAGQLRGPSAMSI